MSCMPWQSIMLSQQQQAWNTLLQLMACLTPGPVLSTTSTSPNCCLPSCLSAQLLLFDDVRCQYAVTVHKLYSMYNTSWITVPPVLPALMSHQSHAGLLKHLLTSVLMSVIIAHLGNRSMYRSRFSCLFSCSEVSDSVSCVFIQEGCMT